MNTTELAAAIQDRYPDGDLAPDLLVSAYLVDAYELPLERGDHEERRKLEAVTAEAWVEGYLPWLEGLSEGVAESIASTPVPPEEHWETGAKLAACGISLADEQEASFLAETVERYLPDFVPSVWASSSGGQHAPQQAFRYYLHVAKAVQLAVDEGGSFDELSAWTAFIPYVAAYTADRCDEATAAAHLARALGRKGLR